MQCTNPALTAQGGMVCVCVGGCVRVWVYVGVFVCGRMCGCGCGCVCMRVWAGVSVATSYKQTMD